jgi:hypothetical protein
MAEITKEYCIQEMRRLADSKGRPPLREEFIEETNISDHYITKLFLGFGNLMTQSGFEPRLTVRDIPLISIEQMWQSYSDMLRKLKHSPSRAEWIFNNFQPATNTFRYKFNCKFSEIPTRFKEFAKNKPEYADVLVYLPKFDEKEIENVITAQLEDFHLFIPPILQGFEEIENSNDFETRVGIAFQLLGFKTNVLGQGQGQNPDGIASRPKDNYAILYDAKSHQDGYSISASDRRAAEQYIDDHRGSLEKDGMKNLFFVFVARSFTSECKKAVQDIREKTNVTTVLLTSSALLQLTASHIQNPYNFDFSKLKALFSKGGQIDENTIQPFLTGIPE